MKDYFKELYECKKELLNELLVQKKIQEAMGYSAVTIQNNPRLKNLQEDIKNMEVDLED